MAKKTPARPEPLTIVCYDFDACDAYVSTKYGKPGGDFWGWVCDNYDPDPGCLLTFARSRLSPGSRLPKWVREHFAHFINEFAPENGDLVLYVG